MAPGLPTLGLTGNTALGGAGAGIAGAGGGGAALGLSSLLGPAALSFLLPMLVGHFFGDPQKKLREQIAALLSPQNQTRLQNQFYQQNISSPAYSQAQGTIATGANVASNQVAQNLAARGLGATGTGAVLSGLTPSLVGSQTAGLRTSAYDAAQQQAMASIQQQIQALMGTSGPTTSQQMFGTGLQAFEPYLRSFFASRYPNTFGLMGQKPSGTSAGY